MSDRFEKDTSHRHSRSLQPLEWLTIAHLGVFMIAATWCFGGQADWVRSPLTAWGTAGVLLTIAALLKPGHAVAGSTNPLWWLVPVAVFNLLVLVAAANPSFREMRFEGEVLLVNSGARESLPSSARPELARQLLWEFDAIWIACFNLVLILRRRRALRMLFILLCANALVLAIFGTAQKLLHAPGLYFGAVTTRQTRFFASFVYHNHWGAFIVLVIGACIGLVVHYTRRGRSRDILHSPLFLGAVVVLILAATIPLSASRSCTILVAVLLAAGFAHFILSLIRRRRHFNESIAPTVFGAAAAVVLGAAGVWWLAGDTISHRFETTRQQIELARASNAPDSRLVLYRDTWRMAMDKPWFGWGMGSYRHVFALYNSRKSVLDGLPVYYHDAHNDWLQALAEHGIVGASTLALCALVPVVNLRRRHVSTLPAYVLGGCALIVLYAWLEFPFGNYAVVLTWWLCYFGAIQYARLTGARALSGTSA